MLASCSPHPNWMPRKPKLMLNIAGKLRRGLWVTGSSQRGLGWPALRTAGRTMDRGGGGGEGGWVGAGAGGLAAPHRRASARRGGEVEDAGLQRLQRRDGNVTLHAA